MLNSIKLVGEYLGNDARGIIVGGKHFVKNLVQETEVNEETFKNLLAAVENGWFSIKSHNYNDLLKIRNQVVEEVKIIETKVVEEVKTIETKVEETVKEVKSRKKGKAVDKTEQTKVEETSAADKTEPVNIEETPVKEE